MTSWLGPVLLGTNKGGLVPREPWRAFRSFGGWGGAQGAGATEWGGRGVRSHIWSLYLTNQTLRGNRPCQAGALQLEAASSTALFCIHRNVHAISVTIQTRVNCFSSRSVPELSGGPLAGEKNEEKKKPPTCSVDSRAPLPGVVIRIAERRLSFDSYFLRAPFPSLGLHDVSQ